MGINDVIALDNTINDSHTARAPERPDDQYFEIFAAEQVLKDFALTDDEIAAGLVGGTDDGGLDGFYFLVDRVLVTDDTQIDPKRVSRADLVLIQATREASFDEDRVNKLLVLTEDVLNLGSPLSQMRGSYNPSLMSLIDLFKETYRRFVHVPHNMTVSYHYVSKGDARTVNASLQKKAAAVKQKVGEFFNYATPIFKFIGAAELLELTRRRPKTSFSLPLSGSPISPSNQQAFIGLVPIIEYYKFLVDDNGEIRSDLEEANVRDWQGNVKVNRAIQATLEAVDPSEDFWWLNNGVTILASEASYAGNILRVEDPQIVNGLQTSRSIVNFLKTHQDRLNDKRQVLVRVISVQQPESQDRIIKATNSQTAMPDYRLYATEKLQMDIEVALKPLGLFYDRRHNLYKNQGKPIARIVTPLFLAQSVMSIVLLRPNDARASPARVLAAERAKIFSVRFHLSVFSTCVRMMMRVDEYLRAPGLSLDRATRSNIRFYMVMDVACSLTRTVKPNARHIEKVKLPDNGAVYDASYERVEREYNALGASDQAAKGNELVAAVKRRLVEAIR